ncbi:MAG: SulP family inorganic anion transporter, partial [Canibacter sp.]
MTKTQTGRLRNLLPSRADYRLLPRNWGRDLVAGITVGIVALPLALAFAISSGASPEMGLVTAVIAGFVAAVFGGSNVQVSGPTGAMVVILLPIAVTHGMLALPIVAIMGGIIVVVAGVLRLGRTVSFIPWPVIEGFTAGIAVIIFLQQVPAVLGTTAGKSTNTLIATVQSFATVSSPGVLWAVAAAGLTVIIMLVARRIHPIIPGSIIAIIIVTVLVEVTAAPVARIGELPSSLPAPSLPAVDIAVLGSLIMPAFAVAALTAIES